MNTILSAEYVNVVYFKNATVPLTANPVTYVRGLNKNSDPANPTGNGVGKSLLLSAMFNVPLGHPVITHKKRGNKDLFGGAESLIALTFKPHASEHIYRVEQRAKGLKIFRDGEDLQLTGKTAPQEYLKKIFPINEDELFITQYVTSLRDYPLQVAKDDQRLQMIISLFRLDQYSKMHAHFQRKLREVKDSETKVSVIEAELLKLRGELYDCPAAMNRAEYEELEQEADALARDLNKRRRAMYELESQLQTLQNLQGIEAKLDTFRKTYKKYGVAKDPDTYMQELRRSLEALSRYEDYVESRKKYDVRLAKAEAALDELKEYADIDRKKVVSRIDKLRTLIADAKTNQRRLDAYNERLDELNADLDEAASKLYDSGAIDIPYAGNEKAFIKKAKALASRDEDELRESIGISKSLLRLESLMHEHGEDGKCPTCTQTIDVTALNKQLKIARKNIKRDEAALSMIRFAKNLLSLVDSIAKHTADAPEQSEVDVDKLRKELAECEEQLDRCEQFSEADKRLTLLHEHAPKKIKKPDIDLSADELSARIEFCSSIVKLLSKKEGLLQGDATLTELKTTSSVEQRIEHCESLIRRDKKVIDKDEQRLAEMQERLQQAKRVSSNRKLLKKQIAGLDAQLQEAMPLIARKRQFEVLVKAYSTKGLRAFAARNVCELIERNLNLYRPLTFMEPYEFSIEVSDSGVAILVDRKKGPKSDVRLLSGAESDSFRLLCLLAILPLLPDSLRINMVTLDEPCSHMDAASSALIRDRFIPALRELVPNIFIITQNPDETADNSAEWTVVKSGNYSKLVGA